MRWAICVEDLGAVLHNTRAFFRGRKAAGCWKAQCKAHLTLCGAQSGSSELNPVSESDERVQKWSVPYQTCSLQYISKGSS